MSAFHEYLWAVTRDGDRLIAFEEVIDDSLEVLVVANPLRCSAARDHQPVVIAGVDLLECVFCLRVITAPDDKRVPVVDDVVNFSFDRAGFGCGNRRLDVVFGVQPEQRIVELLALEAVARDDEYFLSYYTHFMVVLVSLRGVACGNREPYSGHVPGCVARQPQVCFADIYRIDGLSRFEHIGLTARLGELL